MFGLAAAFVKIGTLDEIPTWIQPDAHVFVRSKLPFILIEEGATTWESWPENMDYLPEESVKRMTALKSDVKEILAGLQT